MCIEKGMQPLLEFISQKDKFWSTESLYFYKYLLAYVKILKRTIVLAVQGKLSCPDIKLSYIEFHPSSLWLKFIKKVVSYNFCQFKQNLNLFLLLQNLVISANYNSKFSSLYNCYKAMPKISKKQFLVKHFVERMWTSDCKI